ncbi:hypothetical protein [Streptomyces sp. CB01881]|uniref:hypothetical protein n=1 Tax=Streptomyces sp. CB01881 TaxID=2078691 RepID=UPI0011DFCEA0|nr:hypothetical protein [Streptomyces sp. CB01881]TYC72634.1 hypothetical protein EH183_10145 [Streptomyces sp. CB01881]
MPEQRKRSSHARKDNSDSPTAGQQALAALELVLSFDAISSVLATTDADGHETMLHLAPPFLLKLAAIEVATDQPSTA